MRTTGPGAGMVHGVPRPSLVLKLVGGVFYSVKRLPPVIQELAMANPILYMVEGLRFGILGRSDVSPYLGLGILVVVSGVALAVAYHWLRIGYKLRS